MYNSDHTAQSGQSFTLHVSRDDATKQTTVRCPAHPEVPPTVDPDQRYAIQQMRRRLDEHTHRGFHTQRALLVGHNPYADEEG